MFALRSNRISLPLAIAALIGLAILSVSASAQQVVPPDVLTDASGYKYLKPYIAPDVKGAELAKARIAYNNGLSLVRKVLSGQIPQADNQREFDYFYLRMYFPQYTLTTDEAMGDLPIERHKLFRDHLEPCTVPAVHKYLAEMTLAQMKAIVTDNYHPVCRYNAMLVISGLNDVETVRIGAVRSTPEPMIAALNFIYEQFKKADNTDAVKMACLLGLNRHLEWDSFRGPVDAPTPAIPGPTRDAIVKDLLALALQTDPPPGREALGHEWFRRRAIEGLTHANYAKVDPAVADAFNALLKNESESVAIRCAAAVAIGKVAYQAPAKLEVKPTALELGYLALVACDKELARAAAQRKEDEDRLMQLSGGGPGSSGMGGAGSGYGGSGSSGYGGSGGSGYGGGYGRSGYGRSGSGADAAEGGSGPGPSGRMPRSAPGSRGMGSGGMMPGGEGYGAAAPPDPKQYRFDLIRRRLRAQLYAVEVGLGGPEPHLKTKPTDPVTGPPRGMEALAKDKPDDARFVKDVKDQLAKIIEAVENADASFTELEKDLRKQMKPLEKITRTIAAPAPVESLEDAPEAPLPVPAAARPAPAAAAPAPAAEAGGKTAPAAAGPKPTSPAATDPPAPAPAPPAIPAAAPAPVPAQPPAAAAPGG